MKGRRKLISTVMHFNQFCYLDFHLPNTLHTLSIQKVTYNKDTVTHCLFMDRLYILSPSSLSEPTLVSHSMQTQLSTDSFEIN